MRTFAAVHNVGSGTEETIGPVAKGSAYLGCCGREMVYAQRTKPRCGQTTDRKSCSNATDLFSRRLPHRDHQMLVGRIRPHDVGHRRVRFGASRVHIE